MNSQTSVAPESSFELATQNLNQDILTVVDFESEARISSKDIAKSLGIEHGNFLETIRSYTSDLQEFGGLPFETETLQTAGGRQKSTFALLNEDQCYFAGTLARNTQTAVIFKKQLVKTFAKARNIIKSQTEEDMIKRLYPKTDNNFVLLAAENIRQIRVLELESKQKDTQIGTLASDIQATMECKAKDYKTVLKVNKADIGKSINALVSKHFRDSGTDFSTAHQRSWIAYKEDTGKSYFGATKSSYEEKVDFLNWLLKL